MLISRLLSVLHAQPSSLLRHPELPAAANLHAYIHYVDASSETAIVLLCGGMPDFPALSAARQQMQQQLEAVGALQAVQRAAQDTALRLGGREFDATSSSGRNGALLAVLNLPPAAGGGAFGATPLLHLVYKLNSRQQYVMSPFSQPLLAGGMQQVRALPAVHKFLTAWLRSSPLAGRSCGPQLSPCCSPPSFHLAPSILLAPCRC